MTNRRSLRASLLLSTVACALGLAGCGQAGDVDGAPSVTDGGAVDTAPGELHLEASADLFADAAFAAEAEASAPGVTASIAVEAWGSADVDARVLASASGGAVVLEEVRGGGQVAIEGGLALDGELVVDLPGIAEYAGPIPGLADHEIRFEAVRAVEVMSSERSAARAELAAGEQAGFDLPGIDGGRLTIAIGAGSFLETELVAGCADADQRVVEIRGRLVTSGHVVLEPTLEAEAPLIGVQAMALASVEVEVHGEAEVILRASVEELARGPVSGGMQLPSCR